jgi:hypothetical protein
MFDLKHYTTEFEDYKAMDNIFDEVRSNITQNGIDLETLKKVYRRMPMYYKMLNWNDVISIDKVKFEIDGIGGELFSTAYKMSCMMKRRDKVKFKRYEFDLVWYAAATVKNMTIGTARRIIEEVADHRYFRNKGIHLLEVSDMIIWKKFAIDVIKMNPNTTDDIKLFIELQ